MFVVKMTTLGYRNILKLRVGRYIIAVIYINITRCDVKRVFPVERNFFYFLPGLIYKKLNRPLIPPVCRCYIGSLISTSS